MLTILKHAKNFIGNDAAAPIFKGVYFSGDYIAVSNKNALIVRTNFPSDKKLIHWGTGAPIDGTYPNIIKIVPDKCSTSFEITDLKAWIRSLKIVKSIDQYCRLELYSDDSVVTLQAKTLASEEYYQSDMKMRLMRGSDRLIIYFQTEYLINILAFFKDSGVTVVTMGFNDPLSPIKLTTDEDVLAVLCSVRL